MCGGNRHGRVTPPKGHLYFEEDKWSPVFPCFVDFTICQTSAFLFAPSCVYIASVSCFLYSLCNLFSCNLTCSYQ